MTDQEMRELDAWINNHLFDGSNYVGLVKRGYWYRPNAQGYTSNELEAGRYLVGDAINHTTDPELEDAVTIKSFSIPHYTTDAAAAMLVLEKCAEFQECGVYKNSRGNWQVKSVKGGKIIMTEATTLPLAICLFAKALFSK